MQDCWNSQAPWRVQTKGLLLLFIGSTAVDAWAAGSALQVETEPSRLTIGVPAPKAAAVHIRLPKTSRAGKGAPRHFAIDATAGRVVNVRQVEGRSFAATLEPPVERYPQVAVVGVFEFPNPHGAGPPTFGAIAIPVAARIDLRGKTEPGARMSVEIAGVRYGPVDASARGRFVIPVTVPPGERWASATSRDRLGNAARSRIDLQVPPIQRLHGFVQPRPLVADGKDRAWVFVVATEGNGTLLNTWVRGEARMGALGPPVKMGKGLTRFLYKAPTSLGDGADEIELGAPKLGLRQGLSLPLVAGPPARVDVDMVPPTVPADGLTSALFSVVVRDGQGNHAKGHQVRVTVDGETRELSAAAPGRHTLQIPPRDKAGELAASVVVQGRSVSCFRPRLLRQRRGGLRFVDGRALPCQGEVLLLDARGEPRAREKLSDAGVLRADWFGAGAGDRDLLLRVAERFVWLRPSTLAPVSETLAAMVVEAETSLRWRLPTAVHLLVELMERTTAGARLRVRAQGVAQMVPRVRVESSRGTLEVEQSGEGIMDLVWRGPPGPVDVVAVDAVSGVSAWTRLP